MGVCIAVPILEKVFCVFEFVPDFKFLKLHKSKFILTIVTNNLRLKVLFEDNYLIGIIKPPGIMVENDRFGNLSIESLVIKYLQQLVKHPFIGIDHRLDRPVSGVLLLAKKKSALKNLNEQFRLGKVAKMYYALVENKPDANSDELRHWLKKDLINKKALVSPYEKSGWLKCELNYKMVDYNTSGCLLKINPLTGKYHQIRAQLSYIGCPIVGDEKYGSIKSYQSNSICLHASAIKFAHPLTNEPMQITSKIPDEWNFNLPE